MRKSLLIVIITLIMASVSAGSAEPMDPLLKLLVAKGVISADEAAAVQKEYEQMKEKPASEANVESAGAQATAVAEHGKAPSESRTPTPPASKKSTWSERISLGGDFRLRAENTHEKGSFDDGNRLRFRYRLRLGLESAITEHLKFAMQLRSGDPDNPVSDNQSFDEGFNKNQFSIAQANLQWRPSDAFDLWAGKKAPKKDWVVSDMEWDSDVIAEGIMARAHFKPAGHASVDLIGYDYILDENKSSSEAWLYGIQLNSAFLLSETDSLGLGLGFEYFENPQAVVDLTLEGKLHGNHVSNFLDEDGRLISDFHIGQFQAWWKNTTSKRWPLKISLFAYQNFGARGIAEDADTATFGRISLGAHKHPGQMQLRYTYYYSEADALFYAYTQSDTRRSSNLKGHRFDLRLGGPKHSFLNLTWYNTRKQQGGGETMNRFQLDYIVKF